MIYNSPYIEKAMFYNHILALFLVFIFPSFYYFIIMFTGEYIKKRNMLLLIVSFLISLFFIYAHFNLKIFNYKLRHYPWGYYPLFNIGDIFYSIIYFLYTIYSLSLLHKKIKISDGYRKRQYKYIFYGLIIGYLGGITNFFPVWRINFYPVGNLTSLFVSFAIAYALVIVKMINIEYFIFQIINFFTVVFFISVFNIILLSFIFPSIKFTNKIIYLIIMANIITILIFNFFIIKLKKYFYPSFTRKEENFYNFVQNLSLFNITGWDKKKFVEQILMGFISVLPVKKFFICFNYENDTIIGESILKNYNSYLKKLEILKNDCKKDIYYLYFKEHNNIIITEQLEKKIKIKRNISEFEKEIYEDMKKREFMMGVPFFYSEDFESCLAGYLLVGGKVTGNLFTYEDIMLIKHFTKSMEVIIDNVKKRSTIIQQTEKLRKEEEKIKRIEYIKIFAGSVAHDLNNFLTSISNNVMLAKLKSSSKEIREILNDAQIGIEQLLTLNKQLLTFSKDNLPLKKVVNIDKLLTPIISLILRGYENIKVHLKVEDNLWKVMVDESQLRQVISNILINSVQSMPDGGNIYINASNLIVKKDDSLKKGDYVRIDIKDEGGGIPEPYLKKIFEPYFTTKKSGSGLGLAICYDIIRKHNGIITIDSQVGKGTTISIILPAVKKAEEEKVELFNNKDNTKTNLKLFSNHNRVLILDDDPLIRKSLNRIMKYLKSEVTFVKNSKELIKELKDNGTNKKFDTIFLDLNRPGDMDIKKLIKEILKIDNSINVYLVSGSIDNEIIKNYKKYGFKGFICKPYNINELKNIIGN